MTYAEQLLTPEWKAKRAEILERDLHMCQRCMSSKNLQVHHTKYIDGLKAWEYSGWYLLTLCENCHKAEHGIVDVFAPEDFYTKKWRSVKNSISALIGLMGKERDNG